MKTIAVVANHKAYAGYLQSNVERYFSGHAEIRCYSTAEVAALGYIEADIVLVSAFTIFQGVKRKIRPESKMVMASLAVRRECLPSLAQLPAGTRALLCNIDYRTCMQVIAELYAAGCRNIELTPYSGQGEYDRSIKLAITPDERQVVPPAITDVIDIGQRVLDVNCLYALAVHLGVGEGFAASAMPGWGAEQVGVGLERVLGERQSLAEQVNVLLTLMPQGLLVTDVMGRICLGNDKAKKLLEKRSETLVGFSLGDVLPELKDSEAQTKKNKSKQYVIEVDGDNLVLVVTQVVLNGEVRGTVITLDNFEEREKIQHDIRSRLSQVNHLARYHFQDIIGSSPALGETLATARRLARSDASILISGETGTGKEVFAQSIHNESSRRDYNFVAVNCAAIPENLLESEMFGYEEGSFTGARKGGRSGYFELAHRGTIFLDEIAELPLQLQSKLLRVIEEREIIKIGSQNAVDVDVRIIAATNRDLLELVGEGLFREDLYYRLNVLPLRLPPLRERKGDILPLVAHFRQARKAAFKLSPECAARLRASPWRGNVRELRNVVEYLASLEKPLVTPADLPLAAQEPPKPAAKAPAEPAGAEGALIRRFLLNEGRQAALYTFLLAALAEAASRGARPGRQAITAASRAAGQPFTEAEIRGGLRRLVEYGFITAGQGRGGSRINECGRALLTRLKQDK